MDRQESDSKTAYPPAATPTVHDIPERLRPREEMERQGVESVSDSVLLAVLLRGGVRGSSVVTIANRLLETYGSFTQMAQCPVDELSKSVRGMGRVKAQVVAAALEIARRLNQEQQPKRYRVRTPEDAVNLLRDRARLQSQELFWVLHLDAKNYLKGNPQEVTRGLLDSCQVHPREVFRQAVRTAASRAVLVHNHPSGDPTPSAEDIRLTRQLVEAGRIMDIHVLDHVILGNAEEGGNAGFMSMREGGIIQFE